jgi:hypothetical protein
MARRKTSGDDFDLGEGVTPYAEAGVSFAELEAEGFFDCVTDVHRKKAAALFAKIEAKRAERLAPPPPIQSDLFGAAA